jgi:hypothetical protein
MKDMLDIFLSSGSTALREVFSAWNSPGKPKRLVVDVSGLLRICIIVTTPKYDARAALDRNPFGPELQRAILHVIDQYLATTSSDG